MKKYYYFKIYNDNLKLIMHCLIIRLENGTYSYVFNDLVDLFDYLAEIQIKYNGMLFDVNLANKYNFYIHCFEDATCLYSDIRTHRIGFKIS